MIFQGICILLIGLIGIWQSFLIPESHETEVWTGSLPLTISILLVAIGITWSLKIGFTSSEATPKDTMQPMQHAYFLLTILLLFGYYLFINTFGFIVATLLVSPLLLTLFGVRSIVVSIIFTLIASVLVYFVVFQLFHIEDQITISTIWTYVREFSHGIH
ncbi:MAG: tripartite tricarboxylate transporter TctB family protein [Parashewanella sp.]